MIRTPKRIAAAALAFASMSIGAPSLPAAYAAPAITSTTSPASTASTASTPATTDYPLNVHVTGVSDPAPQPHERFTIRGIVTNVTEEDVDNIVLRVRTSSFPLSSRSALDHHAGSDAAIGRWRINKATTTLSAPLTAGKSVRFSIAFDTDDLPYAQGAGDWGVYPLDVVASDDERSIAGARTSYIAWMPRQGMTTRIAWLVPVNHTVARRPDGIFIDDDLGADLGPDGRLGRVTALAAAALAQHGARRVPMGTAAAAELQRERAAIAQARAKHATAPKPTIKPPAPTPLRSVPVTLGLDPAVVDAARAMSSDSTYRVLTDPGSVDTGRRPDTTPGKYGAAAGTFIENLDALLRDDPYIALPYGDPDISALVRAGGAGLVAAARSTGVESTLPSAPLGGWVWPASGVIAPDALNALTVSDVVLTQRALSPTGQPNYTPSAGVVVPKAGGNIAGVVSDPTLDGITTTLVGDGTGADPTQAELTQLFVAETAAITLERPNQQRLVVVAAPRGWDTTTTPARGVLLTSGQLPWLTPTTLAGFGLSDVDRSVHRAPLTYTPSDARAEIPQSEARAITRDYDLTTQFRAILCPRQAVAAGATCDPARLAGPVEHTLFEAASASLRNNRPMAGVLIHSAQQRLAQLRASVAIETSGEVTLLSRSGVVPITIGNALDVPVAVDLCLTTHSARLRTHGCEHEVIGAGHRIQANVSATSVTAGVSRFPVYAQLLTPEGQPLSAPTTLTVRATKYGLIAIVLTFSAAGLLVLAVVVRLVRRLLRARRTPAAA